MNEQHALFNYLWRLAVSSFGVHSQADKHKILLGRLNLRNSSILSFHPHEGGKTSEESSFNSKHSHGSNGIRDEFHSSLSGARLAKKIKEKRERRIYLRNAMESIISLN